MFHQITIFVTPWKSIKERLRPNVTKRYIETYECYDHMKKSGQYLKKSLQIWQFWGGEILL